MSRPVLKRMDSTSCCNSEIHHFHHLAENDPDHKGYPQVSDHQVQDGDITCYDGHTLESLYGPEDVFPEKSIRIYVAKKIITCNDTQPEAQAVAVTWDGLIGQVGTLQECLDWAGTRTQDKSKIEVDDKSVVDKILVPGFVEAHGHNMEGVNLGLPYLGFYPTPGLDGKPRRAVQSFEDMAQVLKEADAELTASGADPMEPIVAACFDPIFFPGARLDKKILDAAVPNRPVFVKHASGHLATVNSAMLKLHNIKADPNNHGVITYPGTDEPNGELAEPPGMFLAKSAVDKFMKLAMGLNGLYWYAILARNAGHTSVTELAAPFIINPATYPKWRQVTQESRFPVRLMSHPLISFGASGDKDFTPAAEQLAKWQTENADKFHITGAKMLLDGSIQGFTAYLREPKYYKPPSGDPNHQGMPNFKFDEIVRQMSPLHKNKVNFHVHCNGDKAVDLMLEGVENVLSEFNWPDHRHTCTSWEKYLEKLANPHKGTHSQLTRPDQYKRMATLGVCANIFTNHCYYWGDAHYEQIIGPRAVNMWACRTALDLGVKGVSMHSDAGVTPIGHLHTMWCAVNRLTASGRVMGEHEKVTPMEALKMATVNAAYELHMDHLIGTIEPGKYADFAVLYENPLEVAPVKIKDIKVYGTIVNGRKYPSSATLAEAGLLKKKGE